MERSYDYEAYRKRYEARKAAGMCPSHPTKPAEEGRVNCAECNYWNSVHGKERRQTLFESGRCKRCGKKRERAEYVHCNKCVGGYRMRRRDDARA